MTIKSNIKYIKNRTKKAQLVIVTKHQDLKKIKQAYDTGERDFAENKVQNLIEKKELLPNDIKWHMIGHLQKNKVKIITPFIHLIQSVDSIQLLEKINYHAEKNNRIINCLIQIKIAQEEEKFGFSIQEVSEILKSNYQTQYPYVHIIGIMGMATLTNDTNQIKKEFESIKSMLNIIKTKAPVYSIGMSQDYKIAYASGSNMIRIGSAIFKQELA